MSRLGKWFRRKAEEYLGRWQEGPEPPPRFREMVATWSNEHPHATVGQWAEFTERLAGEAYRSGFVRGFEHVEREPPGPDPVPDEWMDKADPSWRWRPAVKLEGNSRRIVSTEELPEIELMPEHIDRVIRERMGIRGGDDG